MSDHPLVEEYLRRLAAASVGAPRERQRELQDDVAAHLRDTIPPNATDAHARRLLAEFGEPEALADEAFGTRGAAAERPRRAFLRTGGALVAVGTLVAVVVMIAISSGRTSGDGTADARPSAGTTSRSSAVSVVTLHPVGPVRTTEGRTYVEYARAIETLPALPPNAQYPAGVVAGSEPTEPVMVETGVGAVIADFTWLCAWETEYLDARDTKAYDRVLVAENALRSWEQLTPFDPQSFDGWATNVLAPLDFDDPSGVRADRPEACAQAGIDGVTQ